MFLCEQQEEEWWKQTDTYTASTRYWMRDVTYQNLESYQNWKCLIENRISRHLMFKTYLRWSHKLPNPKLIFKNCRFKAHFDAIVYNFLNFKAISPFFNVCKVWLYTLSQCIGEQNQLGLHIMIHWRSYALSGLTVNSLRPIIGHRNLHLSRQLSGLLGDVILDSDWLPTTLRENQQQCIKIEHSLTMY